MTGNELKVLEIIWLWGGEASVDIIARGIGISPDYVRVLCESLKREGYIDFWQAKLCKLKAKGKTETIRQKVRSASKSSKIVVDKSSLLCRNKKGRLILNY